jgi:hypothetical protein
MTTSKTEQIRTLNDRLRQNLSIRLPSELLISA